MNEIINSITDFIFVQHEPEKSDAIMVVGGSYPEAAEMAAKLWKSKLTPIILIGGGVSIKTGSFPGPRSKQSVYCKQYLTEYDFYRDVLLLNGVPEHAVIGENQSSFTRENAVFARRLADREQIPLRKALLICKSFHARRCLMFYQSAFPDVEFLVTPFDGFGISRTNWHLSELGIRRVLGELKRCGEQLTADDIKTFTD